MHEFEHICTIIIINSITIIWGAMYSMYFGSVYLVHLSCILILLLMIINVGVL